MADLSGDAFVQALQSETITLLVGPSAEPLTVSKALLCLKSNTFARLLSKPDLTELRLQGVGVAVSKIFVCWCYQERLQDISSNATLAERKERKELLIDLWLLGDVYGIPRLQNQATQHLAELFVTPSLLLKNDIEYLWSRAPTHEQLKALLVLTLVAKLENGTTTESIDDYDDLAALPGLTAKLYKALHVWMTFEVPVKAKKNKWTKLLHSEAIQTMLRVGETKRQVPVAVKTARAPARPFVPGEIVEID